VCRKSISSKKKLNVHTRVKYLLRYLCLCIYTYLHYLHLDNANIILPAPAPQVCSCTSLALIPPALFFLYIPITSVTSPPISPLNFSTLTAVGRSQLLARWPGTHSRILSGIQRAAQTVLGVYWKRTCSRVTSASSALGVLNDCALYKSKHSVTHSLLPYLVQSYQYMQQEMKDCNKNDSGHFTKHIGKQ